MSLVVLVNPSLAAKTLPEFIAYAKAHPGKVTAIGYIRAGELRALAATGASRSSELPDVPAVAEFVQAYEASGWIGIGAPKGTPAAIIEKLNSNITAGLADPQLEARIKGLGADPMPMTPAQFGALMGDETEKWAKW